jgi:hypothetical protein
MVGLKSSECVGKEEVAGVLGTNDCGRGLLLWWMMMIDSRRSALLL